MNVLPLVSAVLTLIGFAVPFLHVQHTKHAVAVMGALLGLTLLCVSVCVFVRMHLPGSFALNRTDLVLLRSYTVSAFLCSLLEEVLSARDESKEARPVVLGLYLLFLLLALASLGIGVFGP